MEKKKKVIIIAIDGGNFEVLNSFFEKGLLPNLQKYKYRAELTSVMPPATAVAWASFSTGNHPGKTEIYDFTIIDNVSWETNFINRTRLEGKTLWQYFTEAGIKSCFLNIPLTYPIDKINGVIVSGIETPSTFHAYAHPPELKEELNKIGYQIDVSGIKSDREDIIKEALYNFEKRIEVSNLLLKRDFDFFIVLFRASDIVKHYAWGKEPVEKVYCKIDEFVGKIREEYKNSEVIVMSDHGFEKIDFAFNTNAWLRENGYLKTNFKRSWLSTFGITRKRIYWILDHLKLNFLVRMIPRKIGKKIPDTKINFEEAILNNIADLKKTKAIAKRAMKSSQIFLNTESRGGIVKKEEEEQLKQEIKQKLIKFCQENKKDVIIKTKEELYNKDAKYAPDITIYFEEKGYDTYDFFSPDRNIFVEPNKREDAQHNMHGVIFTDLDLNLENACIVDLVPTLLDYFEIKYLDGNFDGKSLLKNKIEEEK